MRLRDEAGAYGWVSIALHWAMGVVVVVMWFVGNSIGQGEAGASALRLHTTIGVLAYVFLWWRLARRFRLGHPAPKPEGVFPRIGRAVHYGMLLALAVLLVSGPLTAIVGGISVQVFDMSILSGRPAPSPALFAALHGAHRLAGVVLMIGVALHILGVIKHMAVDRDRVFDRMMTPLGSSGAGPGGEGSWNS